MSRCRWFRLKPLTSVWLNIELAAGTWRPDWFESPCPVSCSALSVRGHPTGQRVRRWRWWSTARNQANSGQRGRDKKVTKTADARQATRTLYFTARRSWILQPILVSSSSAPVTCIHPASSLASLVPFIRSMGKVETTSVQKTSVGNVVPCRLRLAARVAQTRSHFQRLQDGSRCDEMITSLI